MARGVFVSLVLLALLAVSSAASSSSLGLKAPTAGRLSLRPSASNFAPLRLKGGMAASKGTVLVTGGAGYIGTHCTVALHEAGYEVGCMRMYVALGPGCGCGFLPPLRSPPSSAPSTRPDSLTHQASFGSPTRSSSSTTSATRAPRALNARRRFPARRLRMCECASPPSHRCGSTRPWFNPPSPASHVESDSGAGTETIQVRRRHQGQGGTRKGVPGAQGQDILRHSLCRPQGCGRVW